MLREKLYNGRCVAHKIQHDTIIGLRITLWYAYQITHSFIHRQLDIIHVPRQTPYMSLFLSMVVHNMF